MQFSYSQIFNMRKLQQQKTYKKYEIWSKFKQHAEFSFFQISPLQQKKITPSKDVEYMDRRLELKC